MSLQKRKRSANWMASEKKLLLDLVTEHFSVIENKKTDGVSMREKLAEWIKISNKYNAQTNMTHRTSDNLKSQWESMKKNAKKEATNDRMELLKTGGGLPEEKTPKEKKEDPISSRILSLIKTSAVGLSNPYDSDVIIVVQETESQENISELAQKNEIETVPEWETGDNECNETDPALIEPNPHHADFTVDWGDYTPKQLQTATSIKLRCPRKEKLNNNKWSSRRRPPATAASIGALEEKRIEAIAMQMKHASEEREETRRLNKFKQLNEEELLKQNKIRTRLMLRKLRSSKK